MMKQPIKNIFQTGFTPRPAAQAAVWSRLHQPAANAWKGLTAYGAAAACAVLLAVWSANAWNARTPEPMSAKFTSASSNAQYYGEAGPRGQEQNPHYIPFQ